MEFFPKLLTEEESYCMGERIKSLIAERGWGFGLWKSFASNSEHPDLESSDPLREHVLYKISRRQWEIHAL